MGTEEVIKVTWRDKEEPEHAHIENNLYDLDGDFSGIYVSFGGYFGKHSPHLFAAAPDLYKALEEAADPLSGYLHGPILDRTLAALAKARGE